MPILYVVSRLYSLYFLLLTVNYIVCYNLNILNCKNTFFKIIGGKNCSFFNKIGGNNSLNQKVICVSFCVICDSLWDKKITRSYTEKFTNLVINSKKYYKEKGKSLNRFSQNSIFAENKFVKNIILSNCISWENCIFVSISWAKSYFEVLVKKFSPLKIYKKSSFVCHRVIEKNHVSLHQNIYTKMNYF